MQRVPTWKSVAREQGKDIDAIKRKRKAKRMRTERERFLYLSLRKMPEIFP